MTGERLQYGRCSQCGAELQPGDARCWLCGLLPAGQSTARSSVEAPPVATSPPIAGEAQPFQFSIRGLLIVTTAVAVCLGALRAQPGLGILLILFIAVGIVPSMIRAEFVRRRLEGDDSPRGESNRWLAFFASFAVTAAAITVGFIAFCVVGVAGIMVACSNLGHGSQATDFIAGVILFASPVVGLTVAGVVYWLAWPRRAKAPR